MLDVKEALEFFLSVVFEAKFEHLFDCLGINFLEFFVNSSNVNDNSIAFHKLSEDLLNLDFLLFSIDRKIASEQILFNFFRFNVSTIRHLLIDESNRNM